MPHFRLETNVSRENIPKNFNKELTVLLAKTVGKPEEKFVVTIVPDQIMTWGGTPDPCATGYLLSVGHLGPSENKAHSKVIMEKICKDLGIPKTRMLIHFNDVQKYEVGAQGTTLEELFHA